MERKHKHLLEVARTLYHQSQVPTMYWGDCVLAAAYTINIMPLVPLNNSTLHEKLYGTKPIYDLLKVFGCLCFTSTLKRDRNKLDARADPCIFIGYSQQQKGYRLYNLKTKTSLISRDVYFHEKCFPYRLSNVDQTPIKQLFILRSNYPMDPTEDPETEDSQQHGSDTPEQHAHSDLSNTEPDLLLGSNKEPGFPLDLIKSNSNSSSRPHRIRIRPTHLQDYHCKTKETAHWCNIIQFHALSCMHKQIAKAHSEYIEPQSYHEACNNPKWVDAMHKELQALAQNHTWEVVPLPKGKKPIGNKWVFKIKLRSNGTLKRFKARLVSKGYNQKQGVDYEETFTTCC